LIVWLKAEPSVPAHTKVATSAAFGLFLIVAFRLYRGEIYPQGEGRADLAIWSPNRVVARINDAGRDTTLIYDMGYRRGWHSDAGPVTGSDGLIAVKLRPGSYRMTLWYRPPWLWLGLAIAVLTIGALLGLARLRRRKLDLSVSGGKA
jgi:uncharacterized membrane protein YfhO